MTKEIFFCIFSLFWLGSAQAQSGLSDEAFTEKLTLYKQSDPSALLFLHSDKTLYTNNENLWFSAYLLKSGVSTLDSHGVLSLALIRERDRSIYLQDKYMMEDGLAFGNLALPDSIPPGNYHLIASTNVLGPDSLPLALYTQPITIKSITQQDFTATLSLIDTIIVDGAVRAKLMVTVNNPDPKLKPSFAYSVGNYRQKSTSLKSILHTITITEEQLKQDRPILLTEVSYNGQTQYLSTKLPETKPKGIDVRFFPEGGYLVEGQKSLVAWEAKTADGRSLSVSGILYEDGDPIDTLTGNSYGMDSFPLIPYPEKEYTFRISKNDFLNQDALYRLPAAIQNGVVLRLKNTVVHDTLKMELFSNTPRNVQVLLHNYREGFASFSLRATPQGASASVALPSLPKGIATVTLLDEEGRPLAERLFFAHYDQGIKATFTPNKTSYDKKEKASVKLKLTDQEGHPARGIVSIAAVQKNRFEVEKRKNIETYVLMEQDLGDLPTDPLGMGYGNKGYLEDMLLIKGWRKYTWRGLMAASSQDIDIPSHSLKIKGQVFRNGKSLKEPIDITVMRDTLFNLISTDSEGRFNLNRDDLVSGSDKKVLLSVNEKNKSAYAIQLNDPFESINRKLAEAIVFTKHGSRTVQNSDGQQLKGLENAISLNEVTVSKNKGDDSLFGAIRARGPNPCGDYVDKWGYLNYEYSINSGPVFQPVIGKQYKIRIDIKGNIHDPDQVFTVRSIIYQGCTIERDDTAFQLSGIYTDKEFYGVRLEEQDSSEPQYLSTLFWQPGTLLDEQGETEFSFLTGDITGDFNIVVQGVAQGDLIFGEGRLSVR